MTPSTAEFPASIRHLKLFDSVARLGSVRKASEECHLSQPAVTQALTKLEERLGVTLLARRANGTYLNDFGAILHKRTDRMFKQVEAALVELGVPIVRTSPALLSSRITRLQIRGLTAIVDSGSSVRAARALGISQASLHRAARDLERVLGVALYVQTSAGIMATPGAGRFARRVKLALGEINSGVEEIEAANGNLGGEIVVGAMLLAGSVVLANVLSDFVTLYPEANIRVLSGNAEDMLSHLRSGEVDFVTGLLRQPAPEGLVNQIFAETPYVIVGRRGHPLATRGVVTLAELAEYDWVVGTPGANRRERFESLFAGRSTPSAQIATCSLQTIKLLLAKSDRLTLLTSYELMQEENLTPIAFGPIGPAPAIGLTTRQGWLPTQLQANFLQLIQDKIVGGLVLRKELRVVGGGRELG